VKQLVLIGEDADLIETAVVRVVPIKRADSLEEAVMIAHQTAAFGDSVVLAPACASFDMFKNFEDRGDTFIKYVEALV
jgi:UDP-N-acetylmuramoylalanine--D-glutamate ligase